MITAVHGDCLDVLRHVPDATFDSVVTDPPYGLEFMGKGWDKGVPGVEFWREILRVTKPGGHLVAFGGTRTYHRQTVAMEDAGAEIRDCLSWLYGSGFPKSHNGPWGGTALKPAWEPAVLARKPLIGTVAANVAAHGVGGLNVDGCRIDARGDALVRPSIVRGDNAVLGRGLGAGVQTEPSGRWPANVCLDEVAAALLDEQTGDTPRGGTTSTRGRGGSKYAAGAGFANSLSAVGQPIGYGDAGGPSRFFYCAKASKAERGAGNDHPTVKPLALMRWIVRLVTPPGGLVLDPFAGSGTTGLACAAEGMRCMLIEQDAHHVEIIRSRIPGLLAA